MERTLTRSTACQKDLKIKNKSKAVAALILIASILFLYLPVSAVSTGESLASVSGWVNRVASAEELNVVITVANDINSVSTTVKFTPGSGSIPYTIMNIPTGAGYKIYYSVPSDLGYVPQGYMNMGGTTSWDITEAAKFSLTPEGKTGASLYLINYRSVSGTVSLPGNAVALPGGCSISIQAEYKGMSQSTTILIPEGENSAVYMIDKLLPENGYQVSYSITSTSDYSQRGYYSPMGTTSFTSQSLPLDLRSYDYTRANITLISLRTISGNVSLPDGRVASSGDIDISIRAYCGYPGNYSTSAEVKITNGSNSASYSVEAPGDANLFVSYSVSDRLGYIPIGYYSETGTVSDSSRASGVGVADGNRTGINMCLLQSYSISGKISLPAGNVAPARGIPIAISASPFIGTAYTTTVTIPEGLSSVPYTIEKLSNEVNYAVTYSIDQNNGYVPNGYYYDGYTTLPRNSGESNISLNGGSITNINLRINEYKSVSGNIYLPSGHVAPAGGICGYVGLTTYGVNGHEFTIPEGENSVAYKIDNIPGGDTYGVMYTVPEGLGYEFYGYYDSGNPGINNHWDLDLRSDEDEYTNINLYISEIGGSTATPTTAPTATPAPIVTPTPVPTSTPNVIHTPTPVNIVLEGRNKVNYMRVNDIAAVRMTENISPGYGWKLSYPNLRVLRFLEKKTIGPVENVSPTEQSQMMEWTLKAVGLGRCDITFKKNITEGGQSKFILKVFTVYVYDGTPIPTLVPPTQTPTPTPTPTATPTVVPTATPTPVPTPGPTSTPSGIVLEGNNIIDVNDIAVVRLQENGSTGYTWNYSLSDTGVIEFVEKKCVEAPGTIYPPGHPQMMEWVFKAVRPGTCTIRFKEYKPWEGAESVTDNKEFIITVRGEIPPPTPTPTTTPTPVPTVRPTQTPAPTPKPAPQLSKASSWAKEAVQGMWENDLADERMFKDYKDNITREEFAMMAVRLYEEGTGKTVSTGNSKPFSDISKSPYEKEILKAYKLKIVSGSEKGKFNPKGQISRQEIAVMILNTIKAIYPKGNYKVKDNIAFKDNKKIESWARPSVLYLYKNDIMTGTAPKTFSPTLKVSRERAMTLMYKVAEMKKIVD